MRIFSILLTSFFITSTITAADLIEDITHQIPEIQKKYENHDFIPNVAQYKNADWSGVVGISRGISVDEAISIANSNPEISFFFYTKGYRMVLETEDGKYRVFHHGDTVFFSGQPWWGEANGLADGFVKIEK